MEEDEDWSEARVPLWVLYAVLLLGPFGLLPVALSRRLALTRRLIAVLPIP